MQICPLGFLDSVVELYINPLYLCSLGLIHYSSQALRSFGILTLYMCNPLQLPVIHKFDEVKFIFIQVY